MKTDGFSLLETMLALFFSMIILFGGVTAVVFSRIQVTQVFGKSTELADLELLDNSIEQDMRKASQFQYTGQHLWITEDDGTMRSYWVDGGSRNMLRAVDGRGALIVSTQIGSVQYTVSTEGGLLVHVEYSEATHTTDYALSFAFAEGTV